MWPLSFTKNVGCQMDALGAIMLGGESWSLHGSEDKNYLEGLAREIETEDLAVEFLRLHGQPAEGIVKAVEENGIDMLVMGSHGHRGLDDLVFGQTVSAVRHAVARYWWFAVMDGIAPNAVIIR